MRMLQILVLLIIFIIPVQIFAQAPNPDDFPPDEYYLGKVVEISDSVIKEDNGFKYPFQITKIELLEGEEKGEIIEIEHSGQFVVEDESKLKVHDKLVVSKSRTFDEVSYYIDDKYRLPSLVGILFIFVLLTVIFAGWRGLTSLLGLGASILVLGWFIVPQILAGKDPLIISLSGCLVIAFISLYLAHGFNKRTSLALSSTIITLFISSGLAVAFVSLSHLFGTGSEESFYLQIGQFGELNLRGLLLGGILIGTLGVLDDITTGQTAAIEEISKANPNLSKRELYKRGLSIGKEHIASLVNTLVLAYAGASLPLFLLFITYDKPFWYILNSQFVAEEIVRALVGSTALVIAVPIATYLAAHFFSKQKAKSLLE